MNDGGTACNANTFTISVAADPPKLKAGDRVQWMHERETAGHGIFLTKRTGVVLSIVLVTAKALIRQDHNGKTERIQLHRLKVITRPG